MNKKYNPIVSIIFVLCMFASLGILLFVQINWVENLYENELWRLKTDISQKTMRTAALLEDELLLLATLTKTREKESVDLENTLAKLIPFWEENAYNKNLLSDIYLIDLQDFSDIREWSNDSFIDTSISDQQELKKNLVPMDLPIRSSQGTWYVSGVSNAGMILSSVSSFLPNYYLLALIDNAILYEIIIPYIISSNFSQDDIYRIRVLDTRTGATLYSNVENMTADSFKNPDFTWILFETVLEGQNAEFRQINPTWVFPYQDGETEIDIPLGSLRSYYMNLQDTYENVNLREGKAIFSENSQLAIEVVHRDGSVLQAAHSATRINLITSISIILLLIFGIIFLLRNLSKSLSLARKQQEFIATVTHELKTPVSVIYSSAQNMADGIVLKPEKIKQYGEIMKEQSMRLSDSIDYFLLYSNVNNSISRKYTECSLNELIDEALDSFSEKIKSLNFTVKLIIPNEIITIFCDKIAIKSVFQNLIGNALKHACDGRYLEIRLQSTVRADRRHKSIVEGKKPKRLALVSFGDHGAGIPHKEQKLIFEAFERGTAASAKQIDGSGIGLNLVKRILEQHGATIRLSSIIGKGSTFTIEFPLPEVQKN